MRTWIAASLAAVAIGFAASAQAGQRYILQSSTWGAAQNAAVAAAGGSVVRGHAETGVAVVESDNPNFLANVRRSASIQFADKDIHLLWQPPVKVQDIHLLDSTQQDIHLLDIHLLDIHLLDIHLLDIHLLDIHLLDIHLLDIHLLDIHLLDIHLLSGVNPVLNKFYPLQWAPSAVNAPAAWGRNLTGQGVRVAIVDGGMFVQHPNLAPNVDLAKSHSCVANKNFDEDDPTDNFWHATHVAGIVAAKANTGGVVGIAPDAKIVAVKVLDGGSGSFADVICGILYAATEAQADIINLSLGAIVNRNDPDSRGLVAALNKVINYATRNGALVVSAAGNEELDLDHSGNLIAVPAQSGNGVAVSATGPIGWATGAPGTDNYMHFASYSNYGNSGVNLAAPGGDFVYPGNDVCGVQRGDGTGPVVRACWVFDLVFSTTRVGWGWAAGTSMAAPAVSAVAALIKQRYPGATPAQIAAMLQQSAYDAGKRGNDPYFGKGYVDADKATQ